MKHAFRILAMVVALVGVTLFPAVASSQTSKGTPIKIGAMLSLTGPAAGVGIPDGNGVKLAFKIINERGGIGGRPVQLVTLDDASSPDTAISKANTLVYTEKVKAIIGSSLTVCTDAAATVTQAAKIPQVAITGQGPAIELTYPYLFHVNPTFVQHAEAVLAYVSKGVGAKRVGVIYDSGYGRFVFEDMEKLAATYGVQIVGAEKYEVAATDATSQAAKVRDAKPDAVVIIGTSAVPFRNAKQVAIQQPIIAAAGAATYEIVKAMGDASDNVAFVEFLAGEDPLPHQAEFVRLYRAEYGMLPKGFEGLGWDAAQIIFKALEKVGADATPAQLGDAIIAVSGAYKGVAGTRDFRAADKTGYQLSSFVYTKISNGQWKRVNFSLER